MTRDLVLVAEGKDERDLALHLLGAAGRSVVQVIDARGKDGIAAEVELAAKSDRFLQSGRCLAVMLDADAAPDDAFVVAARALHDAGLPRPVTPERIGPGIPSSGVYVTPGQGRPGTVEDLLLPCTEPRRSALAQEYVDLVHGADLDSGGPRNLRKARMQAVLAGLRKSPRAPGDGLQQGLLFDSTPLVPLQDFLTSLAAR